MNKIIIITGAAFALTACAQQEAPQLCDRQAIEWDKFGTAEVPLECSPRPMPRPATLIPSDIGRDGPDTIRDTPDTNPTPDADPEPSGKNPNSGRGNGDEDGDPGKSEGKNQGGDEV
jgi:hypothetical protein